MSRNIDILNMLWQIFLFCIFWKFSVFQQLARMVFKTRMKKRLTVVEFAQLVQVLIAAFISVDTWIFTWITYKYLISWLSGGRHYVYSIWFLECPKEIPKTDYCVYDMLCTYGEECCCGKCHPSVEARCKDLRWTMTLMQPCRDAQSICPSKWKYCHIYKNIF